MRDLLNLFILYAWYNLSILYILSYDYYAIFQCFSSIRLCLSILISRYSLTSLKIGFIISLRDMLSKARFGMALSSCYACHWSNQISLSVTLFLLRTLIDLYIGKLSVISQPQPFSLWPKTDFIYADARGGSVISYRPDFVLNRGPAQSPMAKDCTTDYWHLKE